MDEEREEPGIRHCGRCGRMGVWIAYYNGGGRWFHTLDSPAMYEDPDGREWAIGHDIDPLPGFPTDRRTGVDLSEWTSGELVYGFGK